MKDFEKNEIRELPEKYRPLGAWAYFGYSILFSIPVIGFIFLIIFSFSSGNINRRSFARSYFCVYLILGILSLIVGVLAVLFGMNATEVVRNMAPVYY